MLCQSCKRRQRCRAACAALANDLRSREVSQREFPLDPLVIEQASDRAGTSVADLVGDGPGPWEKLSATFPALPPSLVELFILRFYDGLSPREIACRQRVHYRTVLARLRQAVEIMKSTGELGNFRPAVRARCPDVADEGPPGGRN